MQENHCHPVDEDCNPELEYQKTEAHEQDGHDLDTMVLFETAFPLMEKNMDKSVPMIHKQALLLNLRLYNYGSLDPQKQIWNKICIKAWLLELVPQMKLQVLQLHFSSWQSGTSKVFVGVFFAKKHHRADNYP